MIAQLTHIVYNQIFKFPFVLFIICKNYQFYLSQNRKSSNSLYVDWYWSYFICSVQFISFFNSLYYIENKNNLPFLFASQCLPFPDTVPDGNGSSLPPILCGATEIFLPCKRVGSAYFGNSCAQVCVESFCCIGAVTVLVKCAI
jgi:hypothetical protein